MVGSKKIKKEEEHNSYITEAVLYLCTWKGTGRTSWMCSSQWSVPWQRTKTIRHKWQYDKCATIEGMCLVRCSLLFPCITIYFLANPDLHFPVVSAILRLFDCREPLFWQKSNFPMSCSHPLVVVGWAWRYSHTKYWNGPVGLTPGDSRRPEGRTGNLLKEKI